MTIVHGVIDKSCGISMLLICHTAKDASLDSCSDLDTKKIKGTTLEISVSPSSATGNCIFRYIIPGQGRCNDLIRFD